MRNEIEKALAPLIGESLWSSGRAADLEWFQFGERKTVKDYRGEERVVGSYALHVQCAWRITCHDKVVVASRDLYSPSGESSEPAENFHWDTSPNRRDLQIEELFQHETRQFLVIDIEVRRAGSFTLLLEEGYMLDVFPDDSMQGEYWRLFKPYTGAPHFVLTGEGLRD